MQWDGQELNTQLFSPNGPAQEVPVSPTLEVVNERNHKLEGFTPPLCFPPHNQSGLGHKFVAKRRRTQSLPPSSQDLA